jgi:hypothetical protein
MAVDFACSISTSRFPHPQEVRDSTGSANGAAMRCAAPLQRPLPEVRSHAIQGLGSFLPGELWVQHLQLSPQD